MDGVYAADAQGALMVCVDAWYCWTLTYVLMVMAMVGMRVGRQPAAAEVGGGRSQAHPIRFDPIRSVERPAAGHRSVVQGPSKERSDRHATSRQSRAESSDRWGRWFGRRGVARWGVDVSEGEGPSGAKEGGDVAGGLLVVGSMRGGARSADVRVRRGHAGAMREPSER